MRAYTYVLFIKYFLEGIQETGSWWPMEGAAGDLLQYILKKNFA